MELTLPFPPSLNGLFADGAHRRMKSKRYEQWLAVATSALRQQRVSPVSGSCRLHFVLSPPDRAVRDADNYVKAPMDLLVSQGVIPADSNRVVRGFSVEWHDEAPTKPGRVLITVEGA